MIFNFVSRSSVKLVKVNMSVVIFSTFRGEPCQMIKTLILYNRLGLTIFILFIKSSALFDFGLVKIVKSKLNDRSS